MRVKKSDSTKSSEGDGGERRDFTRSHLTEYSYSRHRRAPEKKRQDAMPKDSSSMPPPTDAPLAPQVEYGRRLPGTTALTVRERKALLAQYLATNRGRAAIRNVPQASRAATRILKPLSKTFGPSAGGLEKQWFHIAGPKLSRLSKPGRITGGRDGRVLTVTAKGPAAALISADSANILQRINTYLGAGTIAKLKIVQGAIANPGAVKAATKRKTIPAGLSPNELEALQKGLDKVQSAGLKHALEGLGRAVISKSKSGKRL